MLALPVDWRVWVTLGTRLGWDITRKCERKWDLRAPGTGWAPPEIGGGRLAAHYGSLEWTGQEPVRRRRA